MFEPTADTVGETSTVDLIYFSFPSHILVFFNMDIENKIPFTDASPQSKPQMKAGSSITRSSFLFSQDGLYSDTQDTRSMSAKMNFKQGLGFGSARLHYVEDDKSGKFASLVFRKTPSFLLYYMILNSFTNALSRQ